MALSSGMITAALAASSKTVAMKPDAAFETLISCLGAAGMSTSVAFTPAASAAATSSASSTATSVAVGTTAVAAGASVLLVGTYTPKINSIDVPTELTNQDAEVIVKMNSSIGVDRIYATSKDGTRFYADKNSDGSYSINVAYNGDYDLTVESSNGKVVENNFSVSNIDKNGPDITDYTLSGGILTVTYVDDYAGLDFSSAYGIDTAGNVYYPLSTDEASGTITYQYPDGNEFEMFMSDSLGNESVHKANKS